MALLLDNNKLSWCFINWMPNVNAAKAAVTANRYRLLYDTELGYDTTKSLAAYDKSQADLKKARANAAGTGITTGLAAAGSAVGAYLALSQFNRAIGDTSMLQSLDNIKQDWNNISTTGLMNLWNSTTFAPTVTRRQMIGSAGSAFLKGMGQSMQGAAAGSKGGWIGAVVGGVLGAAGAGFGRWKARRDAGKLARLANALNEAAKQYTHASMARNANDIQTAMIDSARRNMVAYGGYLGGGIGGPIDYAFALESLNNDMMKAQKDSSRMSAMPNSFSTSNYLGAGFAMGGELNTQGGTFTNGLSLVNNGQSHEENPMGGVPMGTDNEGTPNFVEEGESIYRDYVFSDRLKVPDIPKAHIKDKKKMSYEERVLKPYLGMTFSDAAKKAEKTIYGEGGNPNGKQLILYTNQKDKQDTLDAILAVLAQTLELLKQEEERKQLEEALAKMSPEEREALMLLIAQLLQLEAMLQLLMQEAAMLLQQAELLLAMSPEELAVMELLAMQEQQAAMLLQLPSLDEIMAMQQLAALLLSYAMGGNLNTSNGNIFAPGGDLREVYEDAAPLPVTGDMRKPLAAFAGDTREIEKAVAAQVATENDTPLPDDIRKKAEKLVKALYKSKGVRSESFKKNTPAWNKWDADVKEVGRKLQAGMDVKYKNIKEDRNLYINSDAFKDKDLNTSTFTNLAIQEYRTDLLGNNTKFSLNSNTGKYDSPLTILGNDTNAIINPRLLFNPLPIYSAKPNDGKNWYTVDLDGGKVWADSPFGGNNTYGIYQEGTGNKVYDWDSWGALDVDNNFVSIPSATLSQTADAVGNEDYKYGVPTDVADFFTSTLGSNTTDNYRAKQLYLNYLREFKAAVERGDLDALKRLYKLGELTKSKNPKERAGKNRYFDLPEGFDFSKDKLTKDMLFRNANTTWDALLTQAASNDPAGHGHLMANLIDELRNYRNILVDDLGNPILDKNGNRVFLSSNLANNDFYTRYRKLLENGNFEEDTLIGEPDILNGLNIYYRGYKMPQAEGYWVQHNGLLYHVNDLWYLRHKDLLEDAKNPVEFGESIPGFDPTKLKQLLFKADTLTKTGGMDMSDYPMPGFDYSQVLNAGAFLANAFTPTDYSNADAIIKTPLSKPRMVIERDPLPQTSTYVDRNNLIYLAQLGLATTLGNLRNAGYGNAASRSAALISAGNKGLTAIGNALIAGIQANNALYDNYYKNLLGASLANQDAQLKADQANMQAALNYDELLSKNRQTGYAMREKIDESKAAGLSAGLTAMANDLYRNNRDRYAARQAAWYIPRTGIPFNFKGIA